MSAVHASLAGIWGYSVPQTKLNLGLVEMQFPAVLRGLLALFSFFLVDILSHSQFLAPLSHYFYANLDNQNHLCRMAGNYETHIFKKWGTYPQTSHVSASGCRCLCTGDLLCHDVLSFRLSL